MAEQSAVPEKMNATVKRHLTQVYGLTGGGALVAMEESFASPGDRVYLQVEEVQLGIMEGGGKEAMPVVYRQDGQRQAFASDITKDFIQMDDQAEAHILRETLHPSPTIKETVQRFGIGNAVKEMQKGLKVRRAGWNGKGMWLELQVPDEHSKMTLPYVYIRTAQGDLVPWLCSQTDLLAFDWELAE